MRHRLTPEQYADGIRQGDRLLLSRAITLVESRRADDQALAQAVLGRILPDAGKAIRVGITGVPGVGKSTFIESFGTHLTQLGHKLAVLAIDPTSQRSGGSLLGDKTRMETLSMNPSAYIRPSPAGDSLGGVAHHTRETMLLCEAAGFDVILVETVGVGQSETVVHGLVDFFLLLMLAGAGDELQGMKRGIMELADGLAITKADGDNVPLARRAQLDYANALHLFPPTGTGWSPPVLTCSALSGEGIPLLWQTIVDHQRQMQQNGVFLQRRQEQQLTWFRALLRHQLDSRFYNQSGMREQLAALEAQIRQGTLLPVAAVQVLLASE
ncbi:methylmalonyl Co-A mutase-associated GTPase MeaB [Spirosoma rhododendri]|uniref:Methylmalonyl Co-A mutase-associated GTPase MeaB n=1 Tax=Spirosoma rhododendri TaxID=2728024 RepID=A0A7L5DKN8_9BACT|nr:methylmalonyl Co-A mutase-associated GTPase MeaB [Spirosoma rhododendri]QJD79019.1 methylmalonyl Co-A mutase-associated GTPase MeaB [Spirosoma rhododendri]